MQKNTERRSHSMSSKHWAAIDAIAERLGANATTGSRVGLPSWRSLLYQIATGRLLVMKPKMIGRMNEVLDYTSKALNRLPVAVKYVGKKQRILSTLRALHMDPDSSDG